MTPEKEFHPLIGKPVTTHRQDRTYHVAVNDNIVGIDIDTLPVAWITASQTATDRIKPKLYAHLNGQDVLVADWANTF